MTMRAQSNGSEYLIFCLVFNSFITRSYCDQVRTAFACIGNELRLDCPNRSDRIEVLVAVVADSRCYKYSSSCCPAREDCSGPVSADHRVLLDRRCSGRSSCRLQMDRMLIECPSLGRRPVDNDYENVTYRCLRGDDIINAKFKVMTVAKDEDPPATVDVGQSSTREGGVTHSSNVTASQVLYTAAQQKGASTSPRRMHLIFGTFTAVSVLLNCVLISAILVFKRKRKPSTLPNCNRTPIAPTAAAPAPAAAAVASSSDNTVFSESNYRGDPACLDPGQWYEPLTTVRIDHTYSMHVPTYINDIRTSNIYQDIIY